MKTNFPTVQVRYAIEVEGARSDGRLHFPADEWAEMDDAQRDDLVRTSALAARVKTTWTVEGGEPAPLPRRVANLNPSAN